MHFHVLSLFPELFASFSQVGLFGRAVQANSIQFQTSQLRDFAINSQGQVDDSPYGGGSGMVLRIETASKAIEQAKKTHPDTSVVLMSPRGEKMNQKLARKIATSSQSLTILCGRYEGVDERIAENLCDYQICMGDYITMGGEAPAMAFMESIARLLPSILGNPESLTSESFESGYLEHPQYTRPTSFQGKDVPEVLYSGNHAAIQSWREKKSYLDTYQRRPDLSAALPISAKNVSVALVHYPVFNKAGEIITSSLTNLDLSDIARSARSYGLDNFYIVHPSETLRRLAAKICEHWLEGYGSGYNPNRGEAIGRVKLFPLLEDVLGDIETTKGEKPKLISTSAKSSKETCDYNFIRNKIVEDKTPSLIVFGTGWGLTEEIMGQMDFRLEPIKGWTDYNHLSVRAAAAITLDRLFGRRS